MQPSSEALKMRLNGVTSAQVETPSWTAAELERLIVELNPQVAVFD